MKRILVTGSCGLIGGQSVNYFDRLGWNVDGIDNYTRGELMGEGGDTRWKLRELQQECPHYRHYDLDIRNRDGVMELIRQRRPHAVIHAAAQPSHDLAASRPFDDFEINACGTLNLLEACRRAIPESPFIFLSTNKVYGDSPNRLKLKESETRFDYADPQDIDGITEECPIDQSLHSLFGASKLAADVMVQEYGRYFSMPTCCLRGGCLTGPGHSGVEIHGYLSYLIRCNLEKRNYTIYGYQGKQVRDNIHSLDVIRLIDEFIQSPRQAEVYNLGGGRNNSISILESFNLIQSITGQPMIYQYNPRHRTGDHICYISNLSKIQRHYPRWSISRNLKDIFMEIHRDWIQRNQQSSL
ncbi:MAG: NAD-dependent epimerase/dehydratase family protein [Candidatus Delongbacteria bacterium]|nr:NAD-dependent epimerase/dehydratase family protein [Candidatus Delongbacteria bacterium]